MNIDTNGVPFKYKRKMERSEDGKNPPKLADRV
jgi:hypothetical protein